ncbi:MAG TPA: hypothetical protein VM734_33235 [Kofleriaceae bacterium]|nr:hypothetical protein [Kofleriaceae bacterium]
MAHDVGLAAAIGGQLYGTNAMHPALKRIPDPDQRDQVADIAWRRFSWWNLAAHAVVAATWIAGRTMLTGREAGKHARRLTIAKDALVGIAVATGIGTVVLGRILGRKARHLQGPQRALEGSADPKVLRLERLCKRVADVNLIANLGALGTTAVLAMEASESPRFLLRSRRLP